MDLVNTFNTLITLQESAFIAGVIAAFTPCTLSLIPVFLYRFGVWGPTNGRSYRVIIDLAMVVIGFLVSFAVTGLVFREVAGSDFVNVTRLTLGTLLVLMGVLQLLGKVSFQFISKVSHPLLLGLILPWIVSFSPCVLPFLSAVVINGSLSGDAFIVFLLFGLGLLLPASVIAVVGNKAVELFRNYSKVIAQVERWSGLLIVVAGFYLSSQLVRLTAWDVKLAGVMLLGEILVVAYLILRKRARRTAQNYILLAGTLIFAIIAIIHIADIAGQYGAEKVRGEELAIVCAKAGHSNSPFALETAATFNLIPLMLAGTYAASSRKGRIIEFSLRKS